MAITAYILAGGKSSRFGEDKARVCLDDFRIPVITSLNSLLNSLFAKVSIVANETDRYADLGYKCIQDKIPGKGPLVGVMTALEHAETEKALIISCDMPRMSKKVLKELLAIGERITGSVICQIDGETHPFPGIYSRQNIELLRSLVEKDKLSMKGFIERLPDIEYLKYESGKVDFANMNTKQDYEKLRR